MSNSKVLSVLSGKGGSGKTVICLAIAKLFSGIGKKVLLIDCDTSTHGATYFFENNIDFKNSVTTLNQISTNGYVDHNPIKYGKNLFFIPSSLDTSQNDFPEPNLLSAYIHLYKSEYDIIILDCQAGYSEFSKIATSIAERNLIVLEADAISTSALRVLYLQIGNKLNNKTTFQIFNKLSDEERKIYNKIIGGTIFTNLPAIPFDWTVRASFALGKIPNIETRDSAFGIGVIRMAKILFPQHEDELKAYEDKIVGNWYYDIQENIQKLETQKELMNEKSADKRRQNYLRQMMLISSLLGSVSVLFIGKEFIFEKFKLVELFPIEILGGIIGISISFYLLIRARLQIRNEKEQDLRQKMAREIESDIEKYRTLLETDPRLKEYLISSIQK
ncbi:MAG: ParA family protein [Saprospiraceae bacterium]|nr:ParA family protein [Saprospiraceae bacterium]